MIAMTKRLTLHAWIALLAILFSVFAPTVSHAIAAASVDSVEICSTNGYQIIKLAAPSDGVPALSKHSLKHCGYCATGAGAYALPGGDSPPFPVSSASLLTSTELYSAPYAQPAWPAAQSRAPPHRRL